MIRNSPRIAKIKVKVNNKTRIADFLGDGCLISTQLEVLLTTYP